jgi:parvulin-like peptidyl-prolyl isomerase
MPSSGKLFPRLIAAAILIYLGCDLFVFNGPLRRAISRRQEIVARVSDQEITRSQLDRAVRERLWLEGKTVDSLTPETRKPVRQAALDDLIDQELLRAKATTDAARLPVSEAEIDERMQRFLARFDSKDAMLTAMKSQGIASENQLRARLASTIRQEKYVESIIGPLVQVTDAEARAWFDENQKSLAIPERIQARHIFLPTLDHPLEEAKAKLAAALIDLTAGKKDFTTLARETSEDPATKDTGGDLGWMTRSRLPEDFASPVFALPLDQPALIQTRLGWHLVEVTSRKPAELQTFQQAKPEILAALEAIKRQRAITDSRAALRKSEAGNIEIFGGMLE